MVIPAARNNENSVGDERGNDCWVWENNRRSHSDYPQLHAHKYSGHDDSIK